jgi:FkbM family methyltransferase
MKIKHIIKKLFNIMGYEIQKFNNGLSLDIHLKNIININKIDLIVDVGANEDQFGKMMRDMGYNGKIISFEPSSLAFNILKSKCDTNWIPYNFALGEFNGDKILNIFGSSLFSSFYDGSQFGNEKFNSELKVTGIEQVSIRTLDSVLNDLKTDNRIFLKMDTQGYFISYIDNEIIIRIYVSDQEYTDIFDEYVG